MAYILLLIFTYKGYGVDTMKTKPDCHTNLAIHTIVQLIWKQGAITRADLSRISGFSRSTITLNVDRLLTLGIIVEEQPTGPDWENKKRKSLMISKNQGVFVGIELDAHRCEVGLCTIMGELMDSDSFFVDFSLGPEAILSDIKSTIDCLQSKYHQMAILGIGIGLPSPVDFEEGYAVHPAFMPGWHHYPIKTKLSTHYGCPVFVDNEVNTMGLGEAHLSEHYRGQNLLFVKIGMGIGAGLIVMGDIYRGNSGLSGNIGHIRIDCRTEQCKCGKTGCLEAIAGGSALLQKAEKLAEENQSPLLSQIFSDTGAICIDDLKNAAEKGDRATLTLLKDTASVIGALVGRFVQFFDPKAVVLGGELVSFGPQYIDYIRRGIIKEASPWVKSDFEVEVSQFGDQIGMIGSAMLSINALINGGLLITNEE